MLNGFSVARSGFILGEVVFLAVAHVCGGPPWTLVAMTAFLALAFSGARLATLALMAPALLWLVLFRVTGNRELFFPYAMHLAAVVACRIHGGRIAGLAGGIGVVTAFLAIRVAQRATPRVLAVELAVAAVILTAVILAATIVAVTAATRSRPSASAGLEAAIVVAAGLAAYAGLAI